MTKKNYLIVGITALIFLVAIIVIILLGKDKEDWTSEILKAQSYQITMEDCNGKEKILENSTLTSLSEKWDALSNNGPWTGDTSACYTTLIISYDTNGVIQQKEIVIVDNSSLALITSGNTIYYTNASEVINYLNTLFIS